MKRKYFLNPDAELARVYRTEGAQAPIEYWSPIDKQWCRSWWASRSVNSLTRSLGFTPLTEKQAQDLGATL